MDVPTQGQPCHLRGTVQGTLGRGEGAGKGHWDLEKLPQIQLRT